MSRLTSIVSPAFLGVLVLVVVSGCRVHVHGRHYYHHGRQYTPRTKTKVIHHHSHSTSHKTVVHQPVTTHGGTIEYDLHDDAVPPPVEGESSVTIHVTTTPAPSPVHPPPGVVQDTSGGVPPGLAKKNPPGVPPGLAKKNGVPPGLEKKNGVPPGQAKKNGGTVPPGQAKKKKKKKKK